MVLPLFPGSHIPNQGMSGLTHLAGVRFTSKQKIPNGTQDVVFVPHPESRFSLLLDWIVGFFCFVFDREPEGAMGCHADH